ncbi:hypothetical protein CVT24_003649 [Panaeolus cyanescens]|uniref:BTB domain-containing protein n=1 Tax=Panaeolus cyanescens TaxID=181874 RepID=A0A409WMW8_9AGAR|nr:hypothetical protein CVT24_003649 [Panaeolus cyanescens]
MMDAAASKQFHPNFARPPVYIIFEADHTLYKLDITPFRDSSEVFHSLYLDATSHGQGVPNPYVLNGITEKQMSAFCGYIQRLSWDPPVSRDDLLDILPVACTLKVHPIVDHCLSCLNLDSASFAFRLFVSIQSRDKDLMVDSIRAMIQNPLSASPSADISRLPLHVYITITRARETLSRQKQEVARFEPDIARAAGCSSRKHRQCDKTWKKIWSESICVPLLQPDSPIKLADGPMMLRKGIRQVPVTDISKECLRHVRRDIISHPKWLTVWGRGDIIECEAIEKITVALDLHP